MLVCDLSSLLNANIPGPPSLSGLPSQCPLQSSRLQYHHSHSSRRHWNGEGEWNVTTGKRPPAPTPITLTAHVSIPDPTVAYNVYLYDDFADVPTADFNARAERAIQTWQIPAGSGPIWKVTIDVMSDQTRASRAVPVTAP